MIFATWCCNTFSVTCSFLASKRKRRALLDEESLLATYDGLLEYQGIVFIIPWIIIKTGSEIIFKSQNYVKSMHGVFLMNNKKFI